MSTEEDMWKVMHQREDELADKWFKPAGIGLLAGIIGTAIAVSNHPTPSWAVAVAAIGWLACIGSFAVAMGTGYRDGNRLERHINSMVDYPDDFDEDYEDDELDEADVDFFHKVTDPAPAPVQPAPSAGGSLLSSLRQQGQ
ncbi:hypothetical protein [Mycobacteroides abscessus]|uniref:hypothetical protein n=1 Tax=Mycobacteroides abscessus TaxID=36809 RepID=UPI000C25B93E|nr:hypothetical protein [Mycobacteroides abscessus]